MDGMTDVIRDGRKFEVRPHLTRALKTGLKHLKSDLDDVEFKFQGRVASLGAIVGAMVGDFYRRYPSQRERVEAMKVSLRAFEADCARGAGAVDPDDGGSGDVEPRPSDLPLGSTGSHEPRKKPRKSGS